MYDRQSNCSVAVVSRSFANHPLLRQELLARYPNAVFNSSPGGMLAGAELIRFLRGHPKAIVSLEKIGSEVLSELPELRVISKYGVGLDNLDLEAVARQKILLGWKGGVNRRSVAELALMFMLCSIRGVFQNVMDLKGNKWNRVSGFQLSQKVVGIVGCGNVGKELIQLLQPFGVRILAHDLLNFPEFYDQYRVTPVPLLELLQQSDVVSIHLPLDASTSLLMNEEKLSTMKSGAILINTARGGIVDEGALKKLLKSGHLGAAAFDVFAQEPPMDRELLQLPNFFGTPHIGGNASEAVLAMGRAAIEGLEDARPVNEVLQLG